MRTLTRIRELDELDPKLGPQEQIIYDLIGSDPVNRDDLIESLTARLEELEYAGAQTPEGMLSYYQASLQKRRLVQIDGKAERGAGGGRSKNQFFTRIRELDDLDTKLSPMENALFEMISVEGISRDDLISAITAAKEDGELVTKQEPAQIVGLYHRDLMNRRLISISTSPASSEVDAPADTEEAA